MLGAIASGGLGIAGGLLQNSANKKLQQDANNASIQLAAENRAWQEMMSNTAHQREVKDLKAAGLNPILSATGGSCASTPSGNAATAGAAKMEDALGKGVSSAQSGYQLDMAKQMMGADLALKDASTAQAAAQTAQSVTTAKKTAEETKGVAIDNAVKKTSFPAVQKEAALREKTAEWDTSAAGYDAIMNRALDALGGATGLIGNIFKGRMDTKTHELNVEKHRSSTKELSRQNKVLKDYVKGKRR